MGHRPRRWWCAHVYGGGARTPALGHNISRDDYNRATNGGQNRFDASRLGWSNRWNGGWNNNWRDGGYWGDRSWSYGWYNWTPDTWSWWGGHAAAWGLAGLATGAALTSSPA